MARTPGAKNKTAREVEAEGRRLLEKAKWMKKNDALKKKNDALKAERRSSK